MVVCGGRLVPLLRPFVKDGPGGLLAFTARVGQFLLLLYIVVAVGHWFLPSFSLSSNQHLCFASFAVTL
jgi:hypothetical protein